MQKTLDENFFVGYCLMAYQPMWAIQYLSYIYIYIYMVTFVVTVVTPMTFSVQPLGYSVGLELVREVGSWSVETGKRSCHVSQAWLAHSSSLTKPSSLAVTLVRGAKFIAWRMRRLFLEECRCLFVLVRSVWTSAQRLDPPKSRPCAILARLVVVWQISEVVTVVWYGHSKVNYWTSVFAFHIALIRLRKVWLQ